MNPLKKIIVLFILLQGFSIIGKSNENQLSSIFRVNLINPGIELEVPVSERSTIALNPGIGIHGSYLHLNYTNTGITYFISPFFDFSYKNIYNRLKRQTKGRNIGFNSGNYWGFRFMTSFKEIKAVNLIRKDNISFEIVPGWGIQRSFGAFHLLYNVGSVFYFDSKGNSGIFPIIMQLNIGFNLKEWPKI